MSSRDDNMHYDVTVDGAQGRRELDALIKKVRSFGDEGVKAGGNVDKATVSAARSYRQLAQEIVAASKAEQDLTRSVMATRAATDRAKTNAANREVAEKTVGSRVDKGDYAALAALARLETEEARKKALIRQQANKDLESQGRLTLMNDQREIASAQLALRLDQSRRKEAADRQREEAKLAAQKARNVAAEMRAQEKLASQAARDAAQKDRVAARQAQLYNSYMEGQYRHDKQSASGSSISHLNETRYALYDVASTATVAGLAVGAVGAYAVATGTKFESAFTQVERTAGLTGESIGRIRGQLMELSETNPTSFVDISKVAALGAQMNIQAGSLDKFSDTVIKFSATTNSSIDETAMAFGRISNLLDVPSSKFENLGSSIALVGVKSVATESEILSTTQQISGAASTYGFMADQVVGLGAAFASLAIQPEQARGAVTRIFGKIEKAVNEGGPALENYAKLAGMASTEVQRMWQDDPSAFFQKLVGGLSTSKTLFQDLEAIGAKGVYDKNVLTRLAGNPELLNQSLATAKQGFEEGTFLGESYSKIVDDLASKLTILANSFANVAANGAGPFLQALKVGVDVLTTLIQMIGSVPWLSSLAIGLSLAVAGFLLWKGATAAVMAALLALQTVVKNLNSNLTITGVNLRSLGRLSLQLAKDMGFAGLSVQNFSSKARGMGGTLASVGKSMGKGGAFLTGLFAIVGGLNAVNREVQLTEDNLASLKNAAGQSADALNGEFKLDVGMDKKGFKDTLEAQFSGDFFKNQSLVQWGSGVIDTLTMGLTNLSGQWDINKAKFKELGTQLQEVAKTDFSKANSEFAKYVQMAGGGQEAVKNLLSAMSPYKAQLIDILSLLGEESSEQNIMNLAQADGARVQQVMAAQTAQTTTETAELTEGLEEATDATDELADAVTELFAAFNTESDFYSGLNELYTGLLTGSKAFDAFSEAGRTNLQNLQSTMLATIKYGEQMGMSTTESLVPLFLSLQKQGVDTTSLLQSLASQPITYEVGLDIGGVLSGVQAAGDAVGGVTGLSDAQAVLNGNMDLATGYAYELAKANGDLGESAEDAEKKIRTLSDYASDLGGVFKNAFTIRFGALQALDAVSSKWNEIRNEQEKANKALRDYLVEIQELQANRGTLDYQLSVAERYGDTVRAAAIRAELAKLQADIDEKRMGADEARSQLSTSLQGNTDSAIKNRGTMLELVQTYETYIENLANSGLSTEELTAKTAALKEEFIRQAEQLGYSRGDVEMYSVAFDDLTYAIQNVPRDITVAADTNPAHRAVDEFLAKTNESVTKPKIEPIVPDFTAMGANAANQFKNGFASAGPVTVTAPAPTPAPQSSGRRGGGGTFGNTSQNRPYNDWGNNFQANNGYSTWKGYATGGGIEGGGGRIRGAGTGTSDNIPIMASPGEFMVKASARGHYGDDMLNAINNMQYKPNTTPAITVVTQSSAGTGGDISLSSESILDIADAIMSRPALLALDGQVVASAVNSSNRNSSRRGRS